MRKIVYWLSLILIFMIPWEGVIEVPGLGSAAKVVGLAVGAFWVATVVMTGRLRKPNSFLVFLSLFVFWNAVSVFWSPDPIESTLHVGTWVQCLGLAFILWDVYRTRAAVLAGLQAYVLGTYVAIALAIVNFQASRPFYSHYQRYAPGQVTNPDGFGFVVALGIPVACYLAGSVATTHGKGLLRMVNLAYVPAAFLGIALSGTRTAAIAGVVGLAFGLASITRLRLPARIAIFVLLAVAAYGLLPVVQPLKSFQRLGTTGVELTQGTWNGRLDQWRQGLAYFAQHPLLGVGSGMYRSVNTVEDKRPKGPPGLGKFAHNSFLSVLVELGLIGFALFAIILTIAVVHALALPRWEKWFWLTLLLVWAIGASSLTWEYRKTTWLFLPLVVVSASLAREPAEGAQRIDPAPVTSAT
jgi:O-antigen ligase